MTALHHSAAPPTPRPAVAPPAADPTAAPAPAREAVERPEPARVDADRKGWRKRARSIIPGLVLALAVAAAATVVGEYVPLVGSAVPGAVIGAGIAIRRSRPGRAPRAPG